MLEWVITLCFSSSASASDFVENLHTDSTSTITPSVVQSGLRVVAQRSPNPELFIAKYEDLKAKK